MPPRDNAVELVSTVVGAEVELDMHGLDSSMDWNGLD